MNPDEGVPSPQTNSSQSEPPAVSLRFRRELPKMWGGCGMHPNDMSFLCVCGMGAGGGVLSLMCESSWPSPPLCALCVRLSCVCVCLCERPVGDLCLCCASYIQRASHARKPSLCMHDRFLQVCAYGVSIPVRVCVCAVGKAAVSHPQASVACYHGSHTAGTPPSHVLLFFSTSLPYPLPPPLLFPFWLTNDSPTTTNDITTPPNTLLWWIIQYVEISLCSCFQPTSTVKTWMSPVHS